MSKKPYGKPSTLELIKSLIEPTRGNISAIARGSGNTNRTIYNYIEHYPELKEAIEEARLSTRSDIANVIIEQALKGNMTAAIFYMRTQGGWSVRNKVDLDMKATVAFKDPKEFERQMMLWKGEEPYSDESWD